ncbi:MAG: hypothetical protein NXI31_12235 [bacterium]|nr:hypothetical protein [bacterium]
MNRFQVAILFVTGSLAFGCSSGSTSPDVIIDPPIVAIVERLPAPGATVAPTADVVVRFAEPIVTGALAGDVLVVADGSGALPGAVSYDDATRELRWRPVRELPRGALLAVTLSSLAATNGGVVPPTGWNYHVEAGLAQPAIELAASVNPRTSANDPGLFVSMYPNGDAQIAVEDRSWRLSRSSTTLGAEFIPGGTVRGLHVDAASNVAALMVDGAATNTPINVARRTGNGTWTPELVASTGPGTPYRARLTGTDNGDYLVHLTTRLVAPTRFVDELHTTRGGPPSWTSLPVPARASWNTLLATIDGSGTVSTLHTETGGDFVIAQRYDPASATPTIYTVGSGAFLSAIGLGVSVDGRARVVYLDPLRGVLQRRAPAGERFADETNVAVSLTSGAPWYASATGAVLTVVQGRIFRSEANSDDWVEAPNRLPTPRAVAMSPRGEAAIVYYEGPDRWMLVRWRAGEPMDPPIVLAFRSASFNAVRDAAVGIDASGRVVVAIVPDAGAELLAVRVD